MTAPPLPAAMRPLVLRNGDMEAGGDKPDAWDAAWTGRGTIKVTRDAAVFHNGKASLKVASEGGEALGQAGQVIDAEAGAKFTVAGWVRSQGKIKVNVAIQPLDVKWTPITFTQVQYVQNDTGWTNFRKEITLPAKSARFNIAVLIEGDGSANLDDVTIEGSTPADPDAVPPPDTQDPTLGFHGYFPDYPSAWLNFHKLYVEQAKKTPNAPTVFLGDSITQGWSGAGKAQWEMNFASLGAVNFGIGGDKTSQILWRIQKGTLDGMTPKLIVLAIGVNNLWRGDFDDTKVEEGIKACVAAIREKCPLAKVLVIGILPTGEKPENPLRVRVKAINALSAKLADGKMIRFADFGDKFLSPDGTISKAIMPDYLHPNDKGYIIYADNLTPLVKAMLP